MASRLLTPPCHFHEYLLERRPVVEGAYHLALSRLLEGIPARDRTHVACALRAGKKIRGCLCCLLCESLGAPVELAVPRAVAVEMIQAATLIHDDFIDQDVERNGRAATWTVEGPRRAVLIGDMVFAVAIAMMSEIGAEDGRAAARAIARIAKGALHEPLDALSLASMMESDGPAEGIYEEIIRLKTGILFGTACAFGALAAGADRASAAASRRYGLLIGEAYQIADDLEEVRSYLSSSCLDAPRMVSLAPALLRFAPALAPVVLSVLKDERPDLGGLRMP